MKLSRFFIFIIFVFSLSGCTGSAQKSDAPKANSNDKELAQNDLGQQPPGQEDFFGFLDNFNNKRTFQLKRIVFPITVSAPDANQITLTPAEEKIEKHDWELLDLTYDSTYVTRDYDRYTQTVHFRHDTAHVSLRGIDNGIYADYYFKLIDGEWYLVTLSE